MDLARQAGPLGQRGLILQLRRKALVFYQQCRLGSHDGCQAYPAPAEGPGICGPQGERPHATSLGVQGNRQ